MNDNQKVFYSTSHNVWLWSGLIALFLLGICAYILLQTWDDPFYLLLTGFFALIFSLLSLGIWWKDQKIRLLISNKGIKIGRKSLISWENIQSINYVKQVSYSSEISDAFISEDVTACIKCGDMIQISLKKYCRQESEINEIQACIDRFFNRQKLFKTLLPQLNEIIAYDQSIVMKKDNDFLIPCGGFGIGMLGLGLILLYETRLDMFTVSFLLVGVIFICLPFLSSLLRLNNPQNLLITRKIALKITEQGIQDEWLMKHNAVIPWHHIDGFEIESLPNLFGLSKNCLLVHLSDHSVYESTLTWWQKMHYRFIQLRHYPALFICEHVEGYSLQAIEVVLNKKREKVLNNVRDY